MPDVVKSEVMDATGIPATFRYLVPGDRKPIYIASEGGANAALNIGAKFEDRQVVVRDSYGVTH